MLRTSEQDFSARAVVVATGAFQAPRVPEVASQLPDTIDQLHSSRYGNPWLHRGRSAFIPGAEEDARYPGDLIAERLRDGG